MDARWLAYLGSGLVAIASLVPFATRPSESAHAPTAPAARNEAESYRALLDVEQQTSRLREHATLAPMPRRPARDPFRFGTRPAPASPRAGARSRAAEFDSAHAAAAPPPRSPVSEFTLVGMAETRRGDDTFRTAILSGAGDVYLVAVGDRIRDRFTVTAIGNDVVELRDDDTQESVRLALRQPLL